MTVIEVKNLSKCYSIYKRPLDVLKDAFSFGNKLDKFWALKDVSFSVKEGQRVGVIGSNGSGKTTLLRIITGNLKPTAGNVSVAGRVSSMLGLTTALNPEETGIENIKFNLLLNGCRESEIPGMIDEIVDFTELGPFIFSPVRTYSAGMNAKLSFAITTAIQPDVLVVDEVLSVGDAYFVGKAMKRMTELTKKGRALLFVSHSTDAVLNLCDTCLWLEGGEVREFGPAREVVRRYEQISKAEEDRVARAGTEERLKKSSSYLRLGDVAYRDKMKIRLVGSSPVSDHFLDTFLVKKVSSSQDQFQSNLLEMSEGSVCFASLRDSEWGRVFTFKGECVRTLSHLPGRERGGTIWIGGMDYNQKLLLKVVWRSTLDREKLILQVPDYEGSRWKPGVLIDEANAPDGWVESIYECSFHTVSDIVSIERQSRPPVEIVDAHFRDVNGNIIFTVEESQTFTITIDLEVWDRSKIFDVALRIYRDDGVYVFWMSSGEVIPNFSVDEGGRKRVVFQFSENQFGAGTYLFSTSVNSGWDPENNYPYSDVFDRRVNWGKLSVRRKYSKIDFGVLNVKVPVYIKDGAEVSTKMPTEVQL